jgi:HK97 gp10 family phage protein
MEFRMTAAFADLSRIANNLAYASGEGSQKVASKVIHDYAERLRAEAQTMAPVKTGTLRDSITIHYDGPLKATIGPEVVYGSFQEFGTKGPYEIKPKKSSGVLVFQAGGKTVYARRVMHPGVKAHPYMRPALEKILGEEAKQMAKDGALVIAKGKGAL